MAYRALRGSPAVKRKEAERIVPARSCCGAVPEKGQTFTVRGVQYVADRVKGYTLRGQQRHVIICHKPGEKGRYYSVIRYEWRGYSDIRRVSWSKTI